MALMKDGLWNIVTEKVTAPPETDEANHTKFMLKWDRALAIIVLSVHPSLLYLLGDPTNPVEVWKKLADQFQKKTWSNKFHLKKKLYNMKVVVCKNTPKA
jgi:hypothetical protein